MSLKRDSSGELRAETGGGAGLPVDIPEGVKSPSKRSRADSLGGSDSNPEAMRNFGLRTLTQMTKIQDLKDRHVGEKPLLWIDCDPGGDDCFALMWLFALEKKGRCRVLGISTTDGNVPAPVTYAAADKVATLCGSNVKICAQTPKHARYGSPEQRRAARLDALRKGNDPNAGAADIHGADGMGGLSQKLKSSGRGYEDAEESFEQIIEVLLHYPRQVVLVCIGPLTNVADAVDRMPGILMLSRDIVIMGGAFTTQGNITPTAEFNFWADPGAAKKVIETKGRKSITIMPLDITKSLVLTEDLIRQMTQHTILRKLTSTMRKDSPYPCDEVGKAMFLADLAAFLIKSNMAFRCTKGRTGFLVHDASTLAFLFYPETVRLTRGRVKIATAEEVKGHSYVDMRHLPKYPGGSYVALEIDADAVLTVMVQDLMCAISDPTKDVWCNGIVTC